MPAVLLCRFGASLLCAESLDLFQVKNKLQNKWRTNCRHTLENKLQTYQCKLLRLDQIEKDIGIRVGSWSELKVTAVHNELLAYTSDGKSIQVRNKGAELCSMLWMCRLKRLTSIANRQDADLKRLKVAHKKLELEHSVLAAELASQPLSCLRSQVRLCRSDSLHDCIQDKISTNQIVYVFVNLRDEWADTIASTATTMKLSRNIRVCSSVACMIGNFQVSSSAGWLLCTLNFQKSGACKLHLQFGSNIKNIIGEVLNFDVEAEKPTYVNFTDPIEAEQKLYIGDVWTVHFEVVSNLGKPWICSLDNIIGSVRSTTSNQHYAATVLTSSDGNQPASEYRVDFLCNDMPRGLYCLELRINSAQSDAPVILENSTSASFQVNGYRDPRKWSAKDVADFVRQHIEFRHEILINTEEREVDGPELVKEGEFCLRDWLELAPSQRDFRENIQKIKMLMQEIRHLEEEARFLEGPHKVLGEDYIKRRDLEIDPLRIGAGGSAEVFKGVYKNLVVAVKMPPKGQRIDLDSIQVLLKEVRRMQTCSHKNVLVCYGLMVEASMPASAGIVMELCSGSLLDMFTGDQEPSWTARLHAALDAARGLEYLHLRSIIHRDVKPENLLIAFGGAIKVLGIFFQDLH